ncbi:hypothetical protein ATY41_02945 [Leifsonia xyli subsp. xyli]|uniref:Uncharacterized protein n=2 Tax=Leifsonia xyli subsp. xyli TaxID=59736 RepID=Q6AC83_LEIXX|nr:hypothetical protein [Leifsonia xyli]AAT90010.1 hypothetical protein Lxx23700 [Leifsonia xyli subsp. xyli str. CTCB07]ODA90013.1 hypothetical protein ATY41_02945 [Leifsonia xyli subsp. xyli]
MSSRGARVVRGFAAAGVATLVAALFHMAGGGQAPRAVALTLSLTFSSFACIALAGKRFALWRLGLSVPLSQFLFHALFSLSPSASFSGMPAGGHLHAGTHLTLLPGAATGPALVVEGWAMCLAHLAAAALTIAVLRHGEHTFWAVCGFASYRLRCFFDRVVGPCRTAAGTSRGLVDSVPLTLPSPGTVLGGMRRRGPPRRAVPVG